MNYKPFLIATFVGLAAALTSSNAHAGCDLPRHCNLADFNAAAAGEGCRLIFLDRLFKECKIATRRKESSASCGGRKKRNGGTVPPPLSCKSDSIANRRSRDRFAQCLDDRTLEKEIYDTALGGIKVAKNVDWNTNVKAEIENALEAIRAKIEAGQHGHEEQINAVTNALKNCDRILGK
jgi:hypothetical protein